MKSLVADDVLVIRHLLKRTLSTYGKCEEAVNGQETISKFIQSFKDKDPYDFICLDILMPIKTGLQIIKDIRQYENQNNITENKRVKIIMTTILQDKSVVEQANEYGCDG